MTAIDVNHIVKSYAEHVVVSDLSFAVDRGEILGLIGPNGAGKTTTIRMMVDIIKPDSGEIRIFGERVGESLKKRLGYLPEERGLYKKLSVIDSLVYLASLKGMDGRSARKSANRLLERTGMMAHRAKKIDELSKGMAQIIQFIVAIIHNPELVILDEAFSGLDPVNTELLKGMVVDLRSQGKVVILSTHQMNQVEELCDRLLMIDKGHSVLYGSLEETRAKYRGNSVLVEFDGELGAVAGAAIRQARKGHVELVLDDGTTAAEVLSRLVKNGVAITRFEVATPSLNDIFLMVVGARHE